MKVKSRKTGEIYKAIPYGDPYFNKHPLAAIALPGDWILTGDKKVLLIRKLAFNEKYNLVKD